MLSTSGLPGAALRPASFAPESAACSRGPQGLGQAELETVNQAAASVGQPGDATMLRWSSVCHGLSWPVYLALCTASMGQDVAHLVSQLDAPAVSKKCSLMSHLWYKLQMQDPRHI